MSRQYEEEYYRYYGWPYYWQGDALWGMSGFPILELPAKRFPSEQATEHATQPERADAYLRSTKAMTSDGMFGHVCDFMMEAPSWAIRQLVISTGHWLSVREVQITPHSPCRPSGMASHGQKQEDRFSDEGSDR